MENIWSNENLIKILNENGVVVMPTDTIYGLVGKAFEKDTVERIYKIKKRDLNKPSIILIGDINEIKKLGIELTQAQEDVLKEYWPGPVSIVFKCSNPDLFFLHRGTETLALRLPFSYTLRHLLTKTGPLIATSVNPEGLIPAKSVEEAKKYFGNLVDLYVEGKAILEKHSKLIRFNDDGSISVLRE